MMLVRNQDEYMNIFDQISQYMFRMNVPLVSWGIMSYRITHCIKTRTYCSKLAKERQIDNESNKPAVTQANRLKENPKHKQRQACKETNRWLKPEYAK